MSLSLPPDIETAISIYPNCKNSISWLFGMRGKYSCPKVLKYILATDKNFPKTSSKCCDKSKKEPFAKFIRDNDIDLSLTGERQCEGGVRASKTSCFVSKWHNTKADKFMPLFWIGDTEKQWYKDYYGIKYSDCYEVYGMKRTGCVGCPFNSKVKDDLEVMKTYEPKLYTFANAVFADSYRIGELYRDKKFRKRVSKGELYVENHQKKQ